MSVCLLSLFYVCFFFLFIFSRFCNILLFVLQCNNFFFILNFVLCISFFSGLYFCLCLLATPPDTPFRHILLSICEKVAWARIFLNACQLLFRRVVLFWCAAVVVAVVLLFFFRSFLCCSWLFHKYNIPSCFFLDIVLFIFFAFRLAVFVCFFPSHHAFCLLYAFFFAATAAAATVCKF